MPFVDFVSNDDHLSLWYITNTPYCNVSAFDPAKPTIIMLHPLFLDSTWLKNQMEDPRLHDHYNIIAFDLRSCGKSISTPNGARDSWVTAADIAFAHQTLRLPPAHVFAIEVMSTHTALRLAALFPEMVQSLTLVNVPPPVELGWFYDNYAELLKMWCYPSDLSEFEHACLEISISFLGQSCDPDLFDEVIAFWAVTNPPWRRSRLYEVMNCVCDRIPMKPEEFAAITQPTLIIMSEFTAMNPKKYAQKVADCLVNVKDGAIVQTIKGSPEYVTIIPSYAGIVNRMFAQFLARQPKPEHRPPPLPPLTVPSPTMEVPAPLSPSAMVNSHGATSPSTPNGEPNSSTDKSKSQLDLLAEALRRDSQSSTNGHENGRVAAQSSGISSPSPESAEPMSPFEIERCQRKQRMKNALAQLALWSGDPSIANRDPSCPMSFSRLPTEVLQEQVKGLGTYRLGELDAFSPLGMDGRPLRKFSTRYQDHWLIDSQDDIVSTFVDSHLFDMDTSGSSPEASKPLPPLAKLTRESTREMRVVSSTKTLGRTPKLAMGLPNTRTKEIQIQARVQTQTVSVSATAAAAATLAVRHSGSHTLTQTPSRTQSGYTGDQLQKQSTINATHAHAQIQNLSLSPRAGTKQLPPPLKSPAPSMSSMATTTIVAAGNRTPVTGTTNGHGGGLPLTPTSTISASGGGLKNSGGVAISSRSSNAPPPRSASGPAYVQGRLRKGTLTGV